ncbi:hypothetical protein QVD99_008685 [Batrachochytrium dendrobatidis]|nr:hypothetical protein O5D80_002577 [Batrachochytrium dendrobatidis]KAK5664509.1 hypothetical protein QVD99_008685 [Batrachochytrium dendrobatidis]
MTPNPCINSRLLDRIALLPWFIHNQIFAYAGAYTQYIHNRLQQPLSLPVLRLIFAGCFAYNDPLKATALLKQFPNFSLEWESLCIQSHSVRNVVRLLTNTPWSPLSTLLDLDRLNPDSSIAFLNTLHSLVRKLSTNAMDALTYDETNVVARRIFNIACKLLDYNSSSTRIRELLFECACALGCLELSVTPSFDITTLCSGCMLAATNGHYNIIKHLLLNAHDHHDSLASAALNGAIQGGNSSLVSLFRRIYPNVMPSDSSIQLALQRNHDSIIWQLLSENNTALHLSPGFINLKQHAAACGNLELMTYADQHNLCDDDSIDEIDGPEPAARNGHYHTAVLLFKGNIRAARRAFHVAATNGHAQFIDQMLHDQQTSDPIVTCQDLLVSTFFPDHYPVVKVIIEKGIGVDHFYIQNALVQAATRGHLDIFAYLLPRVKDFGTLITAAHQASCNRHSCIIDYIVTHGGVWDEILENLFNQGWILGMLPYISIHLALNLAGKPTHSAYAEIDSKCLIWFNRHAQGRLLCNEIHAACSRAQAKHLHSFTSLLYRMLKSTVHFIVDDLWWAVKHVMSTTFKYLTISSDKSQSVDTGFSCRSNVSNFSWIESLVCLIF